MTVDPDFAAVEAAAAHIAPHAHATPVLRSRSLDALAGAELHFKCENLQRAGAFKFRGACNAVWSLDAAVAARTRGIPAHVVVPEGAVRSKLAAIEAYGATLHRCAPTLAAREAAAEAIRAETGAELVHPYADPRVIAGQGTAALELLRETGPLDLLVTPVGGGGLVSGSAIAAHALEPGITVFGAEPAGAADAFESLRSGERVTELEPRTVCDGLRGLLGAINLRLMQRYAIEVLTVDDADTVAAMRLLWQRLKLVVEPSSAIALAAVLVARERFEGRRIGIVLSGGNVDLDALPWPTKHPDRP